MTMKPLKNPCASCPYRQDVPSGLWAEEEYVKLPQYDLPTHMQPMAVFQCHQRNGHACSGWVACHDMDNNMAVRVSHAMGHLDAADFVDYETDVPVFESGSEAAEHGMADITAPSPEAMATMAKIRKVQDVRQR